MATKPLFKLERLLEQNVLSRADQNMICLEHYRHIIELKYCTREFANAYGLMRHSLQLQSEVCDRRKMED